MRRVCELTEVALVVEDGDGAEERDARRQFVVALQRQREADGIRVEVAFTPRLQL